MRQLTHAVAGQTTTINLAESDADLQVFDQFINQHRVLAFDTETTGLGVYGPQFHIRTAQFGNGTESWVLPVETSAAMAHAASQALTRLDKIIIQNANFDIQVAARCWGSDWNSLWTRAIDTKILAHLVDSRRVKQGGAGHSLEELTAAYIDKTVASEVKGSMKTMADNMGCNKDDIWHLVDIDNETYLRYAGMDPILTYRLWQTLRTKIPAESTDLVGVEHQLARICAEMERTGILVDKRYTHRLSARYKRTQTLAIKKAAALGCANVNASADVIAALRKHGWTEFATTDNGEESADKHVLAAVMADGSDEAKQLAKAVTDGKRAAKWRTTYTEPFLARRDSKGRIHPDIRPLAARTGRMSVRTPAVQTLPSDSQDIRSCLVAEPGHVIVSVDYQAVEMRVIAALARETRMLDAIEAGEDLHGFTASLVFGDGYTDKQRKLMKSVGFGKLYGGGAKTLSKQAGITLEEAQRACDAYDEAYPKIAAYSKRLVDQARRRGYVINPFGRKLFVDQSRAYAAVNFMIQSTARDLFTQSLIRLDRVGYTPYLRLPVHDEVLASVPEAAAVKAAAHIAEVMADVFESVPIATDAEIGEQSWGSIYPADEKFSDYAHEMEEMVEIA
ncbi:DNA polymerase [Haloglycomyces albus]|uniref:DNA polymerase n=1 Tax=Haloglycomyces albus TaxID=526067 RepID=UPI00046D37F5|nr:DNA polymerase [Haloglycomyces albus]